MMTRTARREERGRCVDVYRQVSKVRQNDQLNTVGEEQLRRAITIMIANFAQVRLPLFFYRQKIDFGNSDLN